MTEADRQPAPSSGKGKAFFDRADQVAETGNWDFAIEMYIEGIRREPDNIERGHHPLREVAMKRLAQGGKKAGMIEQLKHRPGKDPIASLTSAEYLLAKQPGSVAHMVAVLKAARAARLPGAVNWIGKILLEAQRQAKKPNKATLQQLAQAFDEIEQYAQAIAACEMARQLAPDDSKLHDALRELGAKYTIQQGKYDQEGSFVKGVKDMGRQKELAQGDMLSQKRDYLEQQIAQARQEYLEDPVVVGKISAFADALLKIEEEGFENEAVDVLNKAFAETKAYQFKMRIGDIRIKQMARRYRKLQAAGDKQAAAQAARQQLEFELVEYADRAKNYPTDLAIKFELGRRQLLDKNYDEAIALLQQAQRDPRRHVQAMNYLAQAFASKGWYREAAETYERALQSEMPEDRSKELKYNLADALEKLGKLDRARDLLSEVVQIDYNYKDARDRLEKLRKKTDEGLSEA